MPLSIELTTEKKRYGIQEDFLLKITFKNTGKDPITIGHPAGNPRWPLFTVRRVDTGETFSFRQKGSPSERGEALMPIEPGKQFDWSLWIRSLFQFPFPADYDVAVQHAWNDGAAVAESNSLRLTIGGVVPRALELGMRQNTLTDKFHVFWVDAAEGLSRLMRTTIVNTRIPSVAETAFAGAVPDRSVPLPSIALNQAAGLDAWLVWMEGTRLAFRFVGANQPEQRVLSGELPPVRILLARNPFLINATTAEVPMWMGAVRGESAKLQLAEIASDGTCHPGPQVALENPVDPLWMGTAFLSNGERRIYLVQRDKDQTVLKCSRAAKGQNLSLPQAVAAHAGTFVGAGISTAADDTVVGALVVRPEGATDRLEIIPWSHSIAGEAKADPGESLASGGADRIDAALVRANLHNELFIALKPTGQPWRLRGPGQPFADVGGEVGQSPSPIELFFDADGAPLLLYTRPGLGFFFADAKGNPAGAKPSG